MSGTEQVPWLRSGVGETPADGGCIMQVIDWIHREEWTDAPPCVHPVIRHFAITVNDRSDDAERQRLLDLAPRMMNTAGGDEALTRKLIGCLARQVYPIWEKWATENNYDDKGSVLACIEAAEGGEDARVAGAAEAAWAAGAAWPARAAWAAGAAEAAEAAWAAGAAGAAWAVNDPLGLLGGLLDRYDELTGRTETDELDFAPVVCAMGTKCL